MVPNATTVGSIVVETPLVQTFKLSGKNVKGKQVLDVNLTMNSSGSGAGANDDLRAKLVGPKGDVNGVPIPSLGSAMVNLKFDQQVLLVPCNPLDLVASDCNYLQGGNAAGTLGTMTGGLNDNVNPVYKGSNPKGTWTLFTWDTDPNATTSTLGTTTLEVKTGKKFAKE